MDRVSAIPAIQCYSWGYGTSRFRVSAKLYRAFYYEASLRTHVDNNDPYLNTFQSGCLVPGSRRAKEWRKLSEATINVPGDMVKDKIVGGWVSLHTISRRSSTTTYHQNNSTAVPCFVSTCPAARNATGKGKFSPTMTLHPEAQKRAQAKHDVVVGDHLPTFSDKDSLPYVMGPMKEVLRRIPVLPMAVLHTAVNPGQYKGYRIPAGASVLGNTRLFFLSSSRILHDANVFVEPEKFEPERFIERNLLDPADSGNDCGIFGFGRRACAGQSMALDTIWMAIASVLSVCNISKVVDSHGNMITPEVKLHPGAVRQAPQVVSTQSAFLTS
ncbi:cytochrome P450 [Lactarius hatsudake]|nr:cytochrome P450 [Lactarius hatsudake]